MASLKEINSWKAEGRAEGMAEGMHLGMLEARRNDLMKIIRLKFNDYPFDLPATIRGMKDLDQLGRWLEACVLAPSMEMFRMMAQDADQRAASTQQQR